MHLQDPAKLATLSIARLSSLLYKCSVPSLARRPVAQANSLDFNYNLNAQRVLARSSLSNVTKADAQSAMPLAVAVIQPPYVLSLLSSSLSLSLKKSANSITSSATLELSLHNIADSLAWLTLPALTVGGRRVNILALCHNQQGSSRSWPVLGCPPNERGQLAARQPDWTKIVV